MDNTILDAKNTYFDIKEMYRYKALDKYFKNLNEALTSEMIDIINGKSLISLRLLDWFVTRYCKKYKITFSLTNNNDMEYDNNNFNVYISYKAQLKTFHKKRFDPFRRNKKFYYPCVINTQVIKLETTIGQLQFFKWLFDNNIINYVKLNFDKISKSMISFNKIDKTKKSTDKDSTKSTISDNSTKSGSYIIFD